MSKKYLATTAISDYWNLDEEIVFLGSWCLIYSQREVWSSLHYTVMPHIWDNIKDKEKDYIYLKDAIDQTMEDLVPILNEMHNEKGDILYWNLFLKPWLAKFIPIMYERYYQTDRALRLYPDIHSRFPTDCLSNHVSSNTEDFGEKTYSDEWNIYVYREVFDSIRNGSPAQNNPSIFGRNGSPLVEKKYRDTGESRAGVGRGFISSSITKIISIGKKNLKLLMSKINIGFGDVFIYDDFDWTKSVLLNLAFRQFSFPRRWSSKKFMPSKAKLSFSNRGRTGEAVSLSGEFGLFVSKMLPLCIPKVFIEEYSELKEFTLKSFTSSPSTIVSTSIGSIHDDFNLWIATQSRKGVKLVGVQHGGGYGTEKFFIQQDIELELSDVFLSWGWIDCKEKKIVSIPVPEFSCFKESHYPESSGILLVTYQYPRYFYVLQSNMPVGAMPNYIQMNIDLSLLLNENARRKLEILDYPVDWGWNTSEQYRESISNVDVKKGKPFLSSLRNVSIVVISGNSTVFLQAMALNCPVILLFSLSHFHLHERAIPIYKKLKDVGILHNTPQSAANHLNDVYSSIGSWWNDIAVQNVRDQFCRKFANADNNWTSKWVTIINESCVESEKSDEAH